MRSKALVILLLFFGVNFGITQQIEKGEIIKDRQFLIDKKEIANDGQVVLRGDELIQHGSVAPIQ